MNLLWLADFVFSLVEMLIYLNVLSAAWVCGSVSRTLVCWRCVPPFHCLSATAVAMRRRRIGMRSKFSSTVDCLKLRFKSRCVRMWLFVIDRSIGLLYICLLLFCFISVTVKQIFLLIISIFVCFSWIFIANTASETRRCRRRRAHRTDLCSLSARVRARHERRRLPALLPILSRARAQGQVVVSARCQGGVQGVCVCVRRH
jgi:hypothetical protein